MLREFLEHGFAATFVRFDRDWLTLAEELAEEQRALLESDLQVRYPALWEANPDVEHCYERHLQTDAPLQAAMLYRLAHGLFKREAEHPALAYFAQFMRVRTTIEVYYSTSIGPRLNIVHGSGAVIGPRCQIGSDFSFFQGVTVGQKRRAAGDFVTMGDGCSLYAGAKIIGRVCLGDGVRLGANAVLLQDAESHSTYAGVPARKVG